jgi:deoxyribonuclease V
MGYTQTRYDLSEKLLRVLLQSYNLIVKSFMLNDWQVSPRRAVEIQQDLAGKILRIGSVEQPRLIAGVDVSVRKNGIGVGAVVVLSYPELKIVETSTISTEVKFPYVPGLLSFREIPILLETFAKITVTPDLVMVDGQGVAHPRGIGLASHLGLCLDIPAIGCAKSRLCGEYEAPGLAAGAFSDLKFNEDVIGAVLRSRTGVKPVYVSVGHKISLPEAVAWVLKCCRGYRLPEPTRLAHNASTGNLRDSEGQGSLKSKEALAA